MNLLKYILTKNTLCMNIHNPEICSFLLTAKVLKELSDFEDNNLH
jgi:hypothetical protein